MKSQLLFLLLSVFLMSPALGQSVSVKGSVLNSGQPIPFAHLTLVDRNLGVIADENGGFIFSSLEKGNIQLRISAIGYKTKTVKITAYENQKINIELEEDTSQLQEVMKVVKNEPNENVADKQTNQDNIKNNNDNGWTKVS